MRIQIKFNIMDCKPDFSLHVDVVYDNSAKSSQSSNPQIINTCTVLKREYNETSQITYNEADFVTSNVIYNVNPRDIARHCSHDAKFNVSTELNNSICHKLVNTDENDLTSHKSTQLIGCENDGEIKTSTLMATSVNIGITPPNPTFIQQTDIDIKDESLRLETESVRLSTNVTPTNDQIDKNSFPCNICHKRFTRIRYFQRHMRRMHSDEKSHTCEICKKRFASSSEVDTHMRTHADSQSYDCEICHKRISSSSNLKKHIQRMHEDDKPYACDICIKEFLNRNELTKHMLTHTGEKPYKCDICRERFTYNTSLLQHMRTHTGEKPYECDVCHKRFTHHTSLGQHMRTHTGEKPYECEICHRRFAQQSNLTIHMRQHIEAKSSQLGQGYKCDICNVPFVALHTLRRHKATHNTEISHECDICHKRFSSINNLNSHMRTHTTAEKQQHHDNDNDGKGISETALTDETAHNLIPTQHTDIDIKHEPLRLKTE